MLRRKQFSWSFHKVVPLYAIDVFVVCVLNGRYSELLLYSSLLCEATLRSYAKFIVGFSAFSRNPKSTLLVDLGPMIKKKKKQVSAIQQINPWPKWVDIVIANSLDKDFPLGRGNGNEPCRFRSCFKYQAATPHLTDISVLTRSGQMFEGQYFQAWSMFCIRKTVLFSSRLRGSQSLRQRRLGWAEPLVD